MRNILYIEDDAFLRGLTIDYLVNSGFNVEPAINLAIARKKYEEQTFDLILLDITLPDGNGLEWAKVIIQNLNCPPIIYLTSHITPMDVQIGFEAGGSDYLKKPYDLQELVVRIKHVLRDFNTGACHTRRIGEYTFNPATYVLTYKGNGTLLGNMQGGVLDDLSATIGQTISKEELLVRYWGVADFYTSKNLDSVIVKLRRHFKNDPRIRFAAMKKVGYRLIVSDQLI